MMWGASTIAVAVAAATMPPAVSRNLRRSLISLSPPGLVVRVGSLNHLISSQQQRWRNREAERLSGLEVDDEVEPGGMFDWEISGFGTLKDLCHVGSGVSIEIREIRSEAHEAARLRPRRGLADSREAVL